MKSKLAAALFAALLAHSASAWLPSGWFYAGWPWAFDSSTGDWYWFSQGQQWVHGYDPAPGWQRIEDSELAAGWAYCSWPFVYSAANGAWYYVSEADSISCANMRTARWSALGAPEPILEAHEAWRGLDSTLVPDAKKYSPGLLVAGNLDGSPHDPRETKLRFKALSLPPGYSRHIRFSSPGKLQFRSPDESSAAWTPATAELDIPGPPDQDFVSDVAIPLPDAWPANFSLVVEYLVRDPQGRECASDRVRLLRPVVMALGDSMTFGFMRSSSGVRLTPPTGGAPGWQPVSGWSAYPDDSQWAALSSPWNVPAHKADPAYQGFRGALASRLPGFFWAGDNTLGHGPRHMGYNGACISHILARAPQSVLQTDPCCAVVVYFAGLNDVVGGSSASSMYSEWSAGIQAILSARQNRGKTLVVGVTLPRMHSRYSMYSPDKQNQLAALNAHVRSHSVSCPNARYCVADAEFVAHDSFNGMLDDGLHYFPAGYGSIASIVESAIRVGLQ